MFALHSGLLRLTPHSTFRSLAHSKAISTSAREFKQPVAEALGWESGAAEGVSLTLSGWAPHYFAITQKDLLARGTVRSAQNPKVQEMLRLLKEHDSK
ncbi:hypothetical protein BC834DRAFT_856620 [Gloeopeniophorella convolvens]|nr:hypothetical protein BC834DRAFT_856620 [Gloeopeniophorella convolvens]